MNERIIQSKGLSEAHLNAIHQLENICNQVSGLTMKLNPNTLRNRPDHEINDFLWYEQDQLVGYLALYAFNPKEAEISAMTHPDYRQQGIFTELLEAARFELQQRKVPDFLFICERASTTASQTMQAIGAQYEVSEYKMILDQSNASPISLPSELALYPASHTDIKFIATLDVNCFGVDFEASKQLLTTRFADPNRRTWILMIDQEHIGKIGVTVSEGEAYINGFCIIPTHRGQGLGTAVLQWLVAQLLQEQHPLISLEVETKNEQALTLYKKAGFFVTTAYDYYRLPVA